MNSPTLVSTAPPGASESTSVCPPRRPLQSGPPSCGQQFVIALYARLTLKTPTPYLPIGTSFMAPGGSSSSLQTTYSRVSVRSSVATSTSFSPLPARHHDFLARVKLHSVCPVDVKVTEEGSLPT